MSLIFADSFDHYDTSQITRKYASKYGTTTVISAASGRRGTAGLTGSTNPGYFGVTRGIPSLATSIAGVAIKTNALPATNKAPLFVWFDGSSFFSVGALITSSGAISIERNYSPNVVLGSTAGNLIKVGIWHYIEVLATIHDTTGQVIVRADGIEVLNLQNVDTRATGAGPTATAIQLGHGAKESSTQWSAVFDDFYICDTSGSRNNTFLGDIKVDCRLPVAAGSYAQWTPFGGAGANWEHVKDAVPNDDTDYVWSDAPGARDAYKYTSGPGRILAVQPVSCVRKDDAGARTMAHIAEIAGADYTGVNLGSTDSYSFLSSVWDANPASSQEWTPADVTAGSFGPKVIA
ncbi:MAG: hypothetical protein IT160_07130 [Bryobacterales bacterium]|nr:hypothetical protein [Bryobacterales bacterium]